MLAQPKHDRGRALRDERDEPWATLARVGETADAAIDLVEAALALAVLDEPVADLSRYRWHIDDLVSRAAARAKTARDAEAQARTLSHIIYEEAGYDGDRVSYDHPNNANLIKVIDRRRGLPVALGILYLHVGEAAGFSVHGLNIPGHFVIRLTAPDGRVVLDPFNGGALVDTPGLRLLLKRALGEDAEIEPSYLVEVGKRAVLLRLQNNLKSRALADGKLERAAEILKRMTTIAPREAQLWFERGSIESEIGQLGAAREHFGHCSALAGESALRRNAETALARLKRKLN
jgi:regulator of sirC expression with transglutaminase-like and TPR domain